MAGSLLFTATWLIAGATRPGDDAWRQPISALNSAPLAPTLHGTIHTSGASVASTALAVSCCVFAVRVAREPGWSAWAPCTVAAGILTIVFIAAF